MLAPAVKSVIDQQADPRIAAQMKAYDFHKVIDNSIVERLVKEGFFEQLFGAESRPKSSARRNWRSEGCHRAQAAAR